MIDDSTHIVGHLRYLAVKLFLNNRANKPSDYIYLPAAMTAVMDQQQQTTTGQRLGPVSCAFDDRIK